jgi:hypothetical protein
MVVTRRFAKYIIAEFTSCKSVMRRFVMADVLLSRDDVINSNVSESEMKRVVPNRRNSLFTEHRRRRAA